MDDYHEFRRDHDMEITAWKDHWSPKYVSMTYGGVVGTATPTGPLFAFNPIEEFFKGVIEAQAVQFWYGILEKDLRRRVRDATLLADDTPKLATVFALLERTEQKLVEEWPDSDPDGGPRLIRWSCFYVQPLQM
ncbi:unnamed protein product [Calypogeia fissa]